MPPQAVPSSTLVRAAAGDRNAKFGDPEHPHWPLVFLLVVTRLCVGAFIILWLLGFNGAGNNLNIAALASRALAGMRLGASTLHQGRPIHAWKALRGLRRSWRKFGVIEPGLLKPATVHQGFRVLRRIFSVAVKKKLCPASPFAGVEFPVILKGLFRPHYVTASQQQAIETLARVPAERDPDSYRNRVAWTEGILIRF